MDKLSRVKVSLGLALVGASLVGCTEAPPTKHNLPLEVVPTSAETLAATGVATTEFYHVRRKPTDAAPSYEIVSRSATGKVLHAMRVQLLQGDPTAAAAASKKPHMLIDGQGHLLASTLSRPALEAQQKVAKDVVQSRTEEYGCIGDIFWTIGGVIVSVPTCAAVVPGALTGPLDAAAAALCVGAVVGGPVAGGVSVYEDCSSVGEGIWNFFFEDDDGTVDDVQGDDPGYGDGGGDGGGDWGDWDY